MLADTWAESKTLCRRRFILVGGERKRRFISDTFQVLILFLFIKKKIKKIKKYFFFFIQRFLYHRRASQSYPWSLGLDHSLNHLSSLVGSVQPNVQHQYALLDYKSITRTISALTGTHLPLVGERDTLLLI